MSSTDDVDLRADRSALGKGLRAMPVLVAANTAVLVLATLVVCPRGVMVALVVAVVAVVMLAGVVVVVVVAAAAMEAGGGFAGAAANTLLFTCGDGLLKEVSAVTSAEGGMGATLLAIVRA